MDLQPDKADVCRHLDLQPGSCFVSSLSVLPVNTAVPKELVDLSEASSSQAVPSFSSDFEEYKFYTANMSRLSPLPRSHSRASGCSQHSTTTYHSFQDLELYEPTSEEDSPSSGATSPYVDELHDDHPQPKSLWGSKRGNRDKLPAAIQMVRQDSGYESSTPPRTTQSPRRRVPSGSSSSPASQSTASSSPKSGLRNRPSVRRAATVGQVKTGPVSHLPRSSLNIASQRRQSYHHPKFYQFPAPECLEGEEGEEMDLNPIVIVVDTSKKNRTTTGTDTDTTAPLFTEFPRVEPSTVVESPLAAIPPQTTHYWTSDRTRRLEYAAIDAARRGVRGWVMRHMVPECFVSNEKRRIGFEDDGGSVRRYRLELQDMECVENNSSSVRAALPPPPPPPAAGQEKDEDHGSCFRVPARKKRRGLWAMIRGKW